MSGDALAGLVLLWRVERRDGIALGLTNHDRDLVVGGFRYAAAPGMTPSAVKRSEGLEPSTMDVGGALSSAAISEADLLAGRWDGAAVTVFAYDWLAGGAATEIARGTIGAVETKDQGFTAELRGIAAALDRPVAEATSAECRAELGDKRCRVPMLAHRRFARVIAADGMTITLDGTEPLPGAYGGGRLRWFGGDNAGLEEAIAASDGDAVTLRRPPRFPPAPGTLVELIEGCDKSIATCAARFDNALNFRGEPYLPGIDLLTRYRGG